MRSLDIEVHGELIIKLIELLTDSFAHNADLTIFTIVLETILKY